VGEDVQASLTRTEEKLRRLNRIGVALSKERELGALLGLILRECRSLLDADAGSIYIIESAAGAAASGRKVLGRAQAKSTASALRVGANTDAFHLRFAAAQNDSVRIPFREITLPLNSESIAGYCAIRGEVVALEDVYSPPDDAPYHYNPEIDRTYKYRCVSMVAIPMRNMRDEVVGVIQLINKKRDPDAVLDEPERTHDRVLPFPADDLDLATTLGNFAGTTIENVRLYDSVNNLFEKFVMAAVRAIDQRDPSTAGHSARVDRLTLGIADEINRATDGVYRDVKFTDEEMVELHYASILHDVGKIGVREHILTKANKLHPAQEEVIRQRAALIHAGMRLAMAHGSLGAAAFDAAEVELTESLSLVRRLNRPGYVTDKDMAALEALRTRDWPVAQGVHPRLVSPEECESLSIRKGSLSAEERLEIESHVSKSRDFLKQIPWTPELANVPLIAGAHHEKMKGGGYPDGIPAGETPLQARIMAVADVFDSLTSADRPYKPAIPLERACGILESMAREGDLDPNVVAFFIERKMWEKLNLKVIRLADANDAQRAAQ